MSKARIKRDASARQKKQLRARSTHRRLSILAVLERVCVE